MTNSAWREAYEKLADLYFDATGVMAPMPVSDISGRPVITVSKERLQYFYLIERLPMSAIAKILNCSMSTVFNLIKKAGIPTRTAAEYPRTPAQIESARATIRKMSGNPGAEAAHQKRLAAGHEFGGAEYKTRNGYIQVYCPEHPKAGKSKTRPKHVLVMERHLGRYLEDNEIVHHLNGIRDDNRVENLVVMDRSEHAKMHGVENNSKGRRFGRAENERKTD